MKRKWMNQAECLDAGLPVEFLALPEDAQLDVCAGCPVLDECFNYGQAAGLSGVVYAGMPTTRLTRNVPQSPGDPAFLIRDWVNGI